MKRVIDLINERVFKSYKSSIVGILAGIALYFGLDLTPCLTASNVNYVKSIVTFLPIIIGFIKKDK
jgi:hypothetical protein